MLIICLVVSDVVNMKLQFNQCHYFPDTVDLVDQVCFSFNSKTVSTSYSGYTNNVIFVNANS